MLPKSRIYIIQACSFGGVLLVDGFPDQVRVILPGLSVTEIQKCRQVVLQEHISKLRAMLLPAPSTNTFVKCFQLICTPIPFPTRFIVAFVLISSRARHNNTVRLLPASFVLLTERI